MKIYVIGIGPGDLGDMTPRAKEAIQKSEVIIGYHTYLELIKELVAEKECISSGMTKEIERCKKALAVALQGKKVALISSGDSGIYGMAGIMLEVINHSARQVPVEVIPGITAASAAASILGAPLMHDFVVISLSDLLTPWEKIQQRIECAGEGDFVVCLYNPKSTKRTRQIVTAREILLKYRNASTPVGIVYHAGRLEEKKVITTLEKLLDNEINMFCTLIIGNSQTYVSEGKMITPRGYEID